MSSREDLHLALALEGTGWHPAAWREPDARPTELFRAGYWTDLVREAEEGGLDLVTLEDSLGIQSSSRHGPDDRVDEVRGRLDTVLVAARVGPHTSRIGLVPTVVTTHTEPFHVSKAIATLDYVTRGRAGVRVRIAPSRADAALFGRRRLPDPATDADRLVAELFGEVKDYVDVLRGLWDSWEDDAEIRDAATGRFIDRDKLHYLDFQGQWFSVKGPSITPRPPQGQPPVAVLGHDGRGHRLAETVADVLFVTPRDTADAATLARAVTVPHVFGDLLVYLDDTAAVAAARQARLDERAGRQYHSDAAVFTGTPGDLAELVLAWHAAGLTGLRLRPATIPHDLTKITRELVPRLRASGVYRPRTEPGTLRELLGLARPSNRFAVTAGE